MLTRLHEGLDYLIYRIYIWGGLAGIVVYSLVMGIIGLPQTGNRALIVLSLPITVWFLGILAYWWWVFLFKDKKQLMESLENPPDHTPGTDKLRNWTTLHTAMAFSGGNADNILQNERESRRPVLIWYGMQNFLVLWVLGNFWVWTLFQDHLPANYIRGIWASGVIVILVLYLILTPILVFRARKGSTASYLASLGLLPADSPLVELDMSGTPVDDQTPIRDGAVILTGNRLGRRIVIEARGKQSTTRVESNSPRFDIQSQSGKLQAVENAPEAVRNVLIGMRRAKRWRGITVSGGPDGITIERESRGQNMWLYDLWLAERLLESLHI